MTHAAIRSNVKRFREKAGVWAARGIIEDNRDAYCLLNCGHGVDGKLRFRPCRDLPHLFRHSRKRVFGTPNAGFERYPGQLYERPED
jgi:hypothetical protein